MAEVERSRAFFKTNSFPITCGKCGLTINPNETVVDSNPNSLNTPFYHEKCWEEQEELETCVVSGVECVVCNKEIEKGKKIKFLFPTHHAYKHAYQNDCKPEEKAAGEEQMNTEPTFDAGEETVSLFPSSDPIYGRVIATRFDNTKCRICNLSIAKGEAVYYDKNGPIGKKTAHIACVEAVKAGEKVEEKQKGLKPLTAKAVEKAVEMSLPKTVLMKTSPVTKREARLSNGELLRWQGEDLLIGERKVAGVHNQTFDLIRLLDAGEDLFLFSELPGTGKTTAITHAAEVLDLPYYYVALSLNTMPSDLLGFKTVTGDYRASIWREWYENGGVMDVAELDNTNPNIFTITNNMLDNGRGAFPDGIIARHPRALIVGNGNTSLSGPTDLFPARSRQDGAAIDRFTFIEWLLDEELERRIAGEDAKPWAEWVQKVRAEAKKRKDKIVISPRATRKGAKLLRSHPYWSLEKIADSTVFKNRAEKEALLKLVPLPSDWRFGQVEEKEVEEVKTVNTSMTGWDKEEERKRYEHIPPPPSEWEIIDYRVPVVGDWVQSWGPGVNGFYPFQWEEWNTALNPKKEKRRILKRAQKQAAKSAAGEEDWDVPF